MSGQSVSPTYDMRETGPRYHVTTRLGDKTVAFQQPIPDPFVRNTVTVGWRDLLRGLLHRRLEVTTLVGGDREIVNDVLELDADCLIHGRSRHIEFQQQINRRLGRPAPDQGGSE